MYAAFEYDAPQYVDFNRTPYKQQKRWIESILDDDRQMASEENIEEWMEEEDIDWFQQSHQFHEASSPPAPPVPLITPVAGIRRCGLGSPGRIPKSSSDLSSSSSTLHTVGPKTEKPAKNTHEHCSNSIRREYSKEYDRRFSREYKEVFRKRSSSVHSPLRLKTTTCKDLFLSAHSPSNSPKSVPRSIRMISVVQDLSNHADKDELSKSPSPPKLFHQLSSSPPLPYSRRSSANLEDIDLTEYVNGSNADNRSIKDDNSHEAANDAECRFSSAYDTCDEIFAISSRVTLKPQRIIKVTSPNVKRVKVDSRLCPAPQSQQSIVSRSAPSVNDIKKLLSMHNQRVGRRLR